MKKTSTKKSSERLAFESRVAHTFGDRAMGWLDRLDALERMCKHKWELTECRLVEEPTVNRVIFGRSPFFGEVVLKIGFPHTDLFTEMKTLKIHQGNGMCLCLDSAPQWGAMLLERIYPGEDLWSLDHPEERLEVAKGIIPSIPISIGSSCRFPSYHDWIRRAKDRVVCSPDKTQLLEPLIRKAEQVLCELVPGNNELLLLHGDLHHANILVDDDNEWRVIDPKGVKGYRCQESARFILEELRLCKDRARADWFVDLVHHFAQVFQESTTSIRDVVLVLKALSICWWYQEQWDPQTVKEEIQECESWLGVSLK